MPLPKPPEYVTDVKGAAYEVPADDAKNVPGAQLAAEVTGKKADDDAASYTHLTLPTKRIV